MPRSAKTTLKTKKQVMTSSIDLEKGFLTAKSDLLNQSEKWLGDLNKQAKQVKSLLAKAQAEKKQAKTQQTTFGASAKKGKSKTAKLQLKKANQTFATASKEVDKLQKEYSQILNQLNTAKFANKKFTSLFKIIEKFNKSWEKKSAKLSSGKKRRKVRKSAKMSKKSFLSVSPAETTTLF